MAKAKKNAVSARDIADKIAALECETEIASFGPKILAIVMGIPRDVFTELDEKPGRFGYMKGADGKERFYMLRRVRNDFDMGRKMIRSFV